MIEERKRVRGGRQPKLAQDMLVFFVAVGTEKARLHQDRLCADFTYAKLVKKHGRDRITYGSIVVPFQSQLAEATVERKVLRAIQTGNYDTQKVLWTFLL